MNNILIGRPEGEGPVWRYAYTWGDDIIMGCKKIGLRGMDCIDYV
jgi:hypothetical protein